MFSAVPILIFRIPAEVADRSSLSGTPDEPCRTRGTGTLAAIDRISS